MTKTLSFLWDYFFISFEKAVNCQFQNYVVDDAVVVVASVIHVEYFIRNAQTAAKQKKIYLIIQCDVSHYCCYF